MTDPVYFVVPGALATRTGGYGYDRRIVEGLRALGRTVEVVELAGAYPFPSDDDRARADDAFSALPLNATAIADGLAYDALPEVAKKHSKRLHLIALIHHPLADETGLSTLRRAQLAKSETRALAVAHRIIATSAFTACRLADYGVGDEKIRVVAPGTDPAPLSKGSGNTAPVLLCAASLIIRKGHADLFHALAALKRFPWRLICVGETGLDPQNAAAVRTLRDELGLAHRIDMREAVSEEELARLYDGADLVVLPSLYEGFGMVVTEAIARGLPVVTTTGGALAETLPPGAGLASPPGDVAGLRENLRQVILDLELRMRLAAGARAARNGLPSWQDAARAFDAALRRDAPRRDAPRTDAPR